MHLQFLQDPGKLKIQLDGFLFKSAKTGKILQIKEGDVDRLEWMQVARGFEVKVITQDGNITKFDGFKESVSIHLVFIGLVVASLKLALCLGCGCPSNSRFAGLGICCYSSNYYCNCIGLFGPSRVLQVPLPQGVKGGGALCEGLELGGGQVSRLLAHFLGGEQAGL